MQCSSHLFFLVVFFYCCSICCSERKATILRVDPCSESEGINKWALKMAMNEADKTFSGTIDITDEINNDYQIAMNFKKQVEGKVFADVAVVNFDSVKEAMDHVEAAWTHIRQAMQPQVDEPYVVPPATYKFDQVSVDSKDIELPIDDDGRYLVISKLYTPDLEEVMCVKMLADVK